MAREYLTIPYEMYRWAIERAGYSVDEFISSRPQFAMYVNQEKQPTVKQLEAFAKAVHAPLAYMMLPSPPAEQPLIPMFRGKAGDGRFDLNVYQAVLDVQGRHEWLSEYIDANDLDHCELVGCCLADTPSADLAAEMRSRLGLGIDWMLQLATTEKRISLLADKMEEAGICVSFSGVVGNDTHRPIDVDECRGFALVSEAIAPMVFVNSADSKTAQLFTLAHELAHVLVGFSAGYAGTEGEFHDMLESSCDKAAAEFLMPAALLPDIFTNIEDTARRFGVSGLAMARRAHDLGLISADHYRAFYLRSRAIGTVMKKTGKGGAFYATAARRVGRLFAAHIYNAVRSNQLSYTEAYRLTGLYGKTFDTFMQKIF